MVAKKEWKLCLAILGTCFAAWLSATGGYAQEAPRGWSIDLVSSQQEVYGSDFEIYAPAMSHWGQLGLVLGSKDYYWTDSQNKKRMMPNGEIALSWKLADNTVQRFSPVAILQLGQSSYKTGTYENPVSRTQGFFTVELDAQYRLMTNNFLNAISVALGVGSRSNYFSLGERAVGDDRVLANVVYPAFRVGLEF